MKKNTQENNKKLVLEAFDTLFNTHDYATAERYWSPYYIRHSNHIEPAERACSISSRASAHAEV
jgi:predicted SnoaL-like aldol condensation-catalyzing enzyme